MNESVEHNVYKPCIHVTRYKRITLSPYKILHSNFVACIARNDALDLKRMFVKCKERGCKLRSRIHACLSCKYFGCFNKHIQNHSRKWNHSLSMDTTFGALFCYKCNDFQYDKDFEKISREQFSSDKCPRGITCNKWTPSIEQIDILMEHDIIDITDIELRGFRNLGNICYASSIFQALIHAPVFRNYFLSLKHRCDSKPGCIAFKDKMLKDVPSCYLCEVSKIVLECFSGKLESFEVKDFMLLLWLSENPDFKPNDMCDSFHFYLHLVNSLHSALMDNFSSEQNCGNDIDVIFSGINKDVTTCKKCGNVFSQTNQFKSVIFNSKPELKSDSNIVTFKDCLEKNLYDMVDDYVCIKCEEKVHERETIFEWLPLICCFNLPISEAAFTSLWENTSETDKGQGVIVKFEEYFDMTPYTHSLKKRKERSFKLKSNPYNFFYLFAVVEFKKGQTKLGHYVSYVRRNRSNWFKCDDDRIEPIALEEVKKINPYLLFYQRPVDEKSRLLLSKTEEGNITHKLSQLITETL